MYFFPQGFSLIWLRWKKPNTLRGRKMHILLSIFVVEVVWMMHSLYYVCQENISHIITPAEISWTSDTRQDGSKCSCCRRDVMTLPSEMFSNLLLSNFNKAVWVVSCVSCSFLTGVPPSVVFCCCSSSHVVRLDNLFCIHWL